ncbi:hypothetical protein [Spiroplasma endosymbiont of Danaus chrysippus]|uniref:hypothetical protein n=1 Tax=Spiroplasma endosymbiont of Danaus chrysippus TaxID=2691041 RepID=UPI00157AFC4A|nr:hypothetical protein [Spiroplasma endosymbiont of Danaus chrysippus]
MKKLLSTITLSALVGTSAGNLKPLFTNSVVSHGFKSNKNLTMINSPWWLALNTGPLLDRQF